MAAVLKKRFLTDWSIYLMSSYAAFTLILAYQASLVLYDSHRCCQLFSFFVLSSLWTPSSRHVIYVPPSAFVFSSLLSSDPYRHEAKSSHLTSAPHHDCECAGSVLGGVRGVLRTCAKAKAYASNCLKPAGWDCWRICVHGQWSMSKTWG